MKTLVHPSPVGPLTLVSDEGQLIGVYFEGYSLMKPEDAALARPAGPSRDATLDRARSELDAYFAGEQALFAVPLAPRGTEFQRRVWKALTKIPFGETVSYGAIAREIGSPAAVRAVGGAVGSNPIAIIIPCHRVVGADGSLTGFGGGLDRKRFLLGLEGGQTSLLHRSPAGE